MNKYRNKKTKVDGILFDSRLEANRYCELNLLQKAGKIHGLELQKRFELFPKDSYGRALYYVADFVYLEDGQTVVEDCKGVKTPVYALKRRIVAEHYGIIIKEILA